jgi:hypothetical protein
MKDKIIVWLRNNWFLWIILIAGYIAMRSFGYDIKIVDSSDNVKFSKGEADDL